MTTQEKAKQEELIGAIKAIIMAHGSFFSSQLMACANSVFIGELGSLTAFAEGFNEETVTCTIYGNNGDTEIEEYEVEYQELNNNILCEILELCENWKNENLEEE